VCAGRDHSLALSDAGALYSWGTGHAGQLGHGHGALESVLFPRRVAFFKVPAAAVVCSNP
jgi:alpha-tubulin suppressor-like RCC1 family protein